jgi:hypothetical protein
MALPLATAIKRSAFNRAIGGARGCDRGRSSGGAGLRQARVLMPDGWRPRLGSVAPPEATTIKRSAFNHGDGGAGNCDRGTSSGGAGRSQARVPMPDGLRRRLGSVAPPEAMTIKRSAFNPGVGGDGDCDRGGSGGGTGRSERVC